jgi:hypothetical protein
MSDNNMNENIGKVKKRLGVFKASKLFLSGLGLCFLFSYPGLCYVLSENEDRFNKEMNSLRSLKKEEDGREFDLGKKF